MENWQTNEWCARCQPIEVGCKGFVGQSSQPRKQQRWPQGGCLLKEERRRWRSSTWMQASAKLPLAGSPGWRCPIVGRPETPKDPSLMMRPGVPQDTVCVSWHFLWLNSSIQGGSRFFTSVNTTLEKLWGDRLRRRSSSVGRRKTRFFPLSNLTSNCLKKRMGHFLLP